MAGDYSQSLIDKFQADMDELRSKPEVPGLADLVTVIGKLVSPTRRSSGEPNHGSYHHNPGGAPAYNGASGGKIYGYNNISESGFVQVAAANTSRVKLHFPQSRDKRYLHRPGANPKPQAQTLLSAPAMQPLVVAFASMAMAGNTPLKVNAKVPIKRRGDWRAQPIPTVIDRHQC